MLKRISQEEFVKLSPESRSKLKDSMQEMIQAQSRNPLAYFVPNGKQEEFIKSIGKESSNRIFAFVSANGVGKSAAVVAALGNLAFGVQSKWFDLERFKFWNWPKRIWYISEHTLIKDVIGPLFDKYFPPGRYTFTNNGLPYRSHIETDTGWTIDLRTYEQEPKTFEGATLGVVVEDEPPPYAIHTASVARLRFGGIMMMPMTPMFESAWIRDEIESDQLQDVRRWALVKAQDEDNCKEHGDRGFLTHENIMFMRSQWEDEELQARARGDWMDLTGRIFKGLSAKYHHSMDYKISQADHAIHFVIDPHDRLPPAAGWFAVDRIGTVKWIAEYPRGDFHKMKSYDLDVIETCKLLKEIEDDFGFDPDRIVRIMDPLFGAKKIQTVGKTVQEMYAEEEFDCSIDVNNRIEPGHRLIESILKVGPNGETKFECFQSCRNAWIGLSRYAWDEYRRKTTEKRGVKEKPKEKYKHYPDLLRYLMAYREEPGNLNVDEMMNWEREFYARRSLVGSQPTGSMLA